MILNYTQVIYHFENWFGFLFQDRLLIIALFLYLKYFSFLCKIQTKKNSLYIYMYIYTAVNDKNLVKSSKSSI